MNNYLFVSRKISCNFVSCELNLGITSYEVFEVPFTIERFLEARLFDKMPSFVTFPSFRTSTLSQK